MINAIWFYRIANFLYVKGIPLIPKLIIFLLYNSIIPYETIIGKNTKFGYSGISVVIHKNCYIGENCFIAQCVTIGGSGAGNEYRKNGVPKVGNNVYIGAGAKVLGDIKIGDNVIIGANAVVLNDLPSNSVAVGVPAKVVKYNIK